MDELNQNYYRFEFSGAIDDIASARLYDLGFESFEEKEDSTEGYISEIMVHDDLVKEIENIHPFNRYELIKQQNWNAIWESSFTPITIEDTIHVRATFHPTSNAPYEIIIDPKMAFGTGHHATTHLVLAKMLNLDFKGKRVLDFGCGSGILAIAAEKLGAREIVAIDYDKWSVENTIENSSLNHCEHIRVYQADNLSNEFDNYDIILANITRDILIQNTKDIIRLLKHGGCAIYSGFIESDLELMQAHLKSFNIHQIKNDKKEDWCVLVFTKD
jgi:ribosomal protein L11 methyltransferase